MSDYKDGIINEEDFSKAPIKILWVLKETNRNFNPIETFGNDFDFDKRIKEFKSNGKHSNIKKTYGLVAKVSYLLLNQAEIEDFCTDNKKLSAVMSQIAIMNVKGTPGKSHAKYEDIKKAAEQNMTELVCRINKINPDIIIFGTTLKIMKNGLNLKQCRTDNIEKIFDGEKQAFYFEDKVFIGAYHPNVRKKGLTHKKYAEEIVRVVKKWNEKKTLGKLEVYHFPEKLLEKNNYAIII